jgi:hypothetical protein
MEELPHVFRRFWPMISFFTILLAGVIVMSTNLVPFQWQITQIFVIIPLLCTALPHLLYITVLNRESLCRLRALVGRSLTPFAPLISLQLTWPVSSSESSLRTFACFSLSMSLSLLVPPPPFWVFYALFPSMICLPLAPTCFARCSTFNTCFTIALHSCCPLSYPVLSAPSCARALNGHRCFPQ